MIKRINQMKENIPIFFIYGSLSWVDYTAGFLTVEIRQKYLSAAPATVKVYYLNLNFK